jgi:NAD(P)H-flavin reductase/ferredoxin
MRAERARMSESSDGKFPISVAPLETTIECGSNETLLDACIQAGIPVSYNCRSGECGECLAKLQSGNIAELPGADPAIFDDAKRAAGQILLCMCFPRSPLSLNVPLYSDGPAIRPVLVDARVREIERVTPTIYRVSLATPGPVEYRAGQCFEWILPGILPNRTYSAANRPGSDHIDFHVRIYPGGKVGAYVERTLTLGQATQIRGPFGHFGLSSNDWRPGMCVAGGTGLAPIHAILDAAFARGDERPMRFYFGARNQDELYCLDRLRDWAGKSSAFQFIPVLSDEPVGSSWAGERGLVTDVVAQQIDDPFGLEAYVCGPPAMIDAAVAVFEAAGLSPDDIHTDRFVQAR